MLFISLFLYFFLYVCIYLLIYVLRAFFLYLVRYSSLAISIDYFMSS